MKWVRSIPWRRPPAPPAAAPAIDQELRIGEMQRRLEHAITAEFLSARGIEPMKKVGPHPVYRESDWPRICTALAANALKARSWKAV